MSRLTPKNCTKKDAIFSIYGRNGIIPRLFFFKFSLGLKLHKSSWYLICVAKFPLVTNIWSYEWSSCTKSSFALVSLHSMATANLNKSVWLVTNTTAASKYIPRRPRISINWNPTFQTSLHKISKDFFFHTKIFFSRNNSCLVFYEL